ncbi:DUF305 domain-containing protein [Williamsia sp.]|uniref:DUF305 domain-containing protein n=1 Tax=Williamsia sp. TaxID=1872085 RepID=UPI002F944155
MFLTRCTNLKIAASGIGVAAVLVLAGCSDDGGDHDMDSMGASSMSPTTSAPSASAEATAQFNDADVMFAQMMYPHHAQAVEMAQLVDGRTTNPRIIELAAAIESAQGPEMTQLQQWLQQWGQPAPSTDMGGMDHGGDGMSGMMTEQDMTDLAAMSGTEFDQAWLTMMIEHHTGAIEMANTEIADGSNEQAKQMASTIVQSQQTEIDTMKALQTP